MPAVVLRGAQVRRRQRGSLPHARRAHVPKGKLRNRNLPLFAAAREEPVQLQGAGAARALAAEVRSAGGGWTLHQARAFGDEGVGPVRLRPQLLQGSGGQDREQAPGCAEEFQHVQEGHDVGPERDVRDGQDLPIARVRRPLGRGGVDGRRRGRSRPGGCRRVTPLGTALEQAAGTEARHTRVLRADDEQGSPRHRRGAEHPR